jgi:DNA-directed RNA polymerase subunit omega
VALREIAESSVDLDNLWQALVAGLQKHVESDEPEEDMMELLAADRDVAGVPYDASTEGVEDEALVEGPDEAAEGAEPAAGEEE